MGRTDASAVSNAMAKIYKMRPDKAQFVRSQETSRHFKPRKEMIKGEEYHWKVWTQPMTAARSVGSATNSTTEVAEWPAARQLDHVDVYATWADLMEIRGTIEYTGLSEAKTKDLEAAVYHVASRLVGEVDNDLGTKMNSAMHQDSASTMAKVLVVHDASGTVTATPGSAAILTITGGSITQFMVGQRLYIWATGTHTATTDRLTCYVNDIIYAGETIGSATGPGIRVTWEAAGTGSGSGNSNLNNVVATDDITLSEEVAASNFYALPTWFGTGAVFSITRTATGSRWSVPFMADYNVSSSPVTLDLETHFGTMALNWSYAMKSGRAMRKADGIEISDGLLALGDPQSIDEMSRQVGDSLRYTTDLRDEQKQVLFGTSGFDKAYWHHPLIGPIALQVDPAATPNAIRFIDPNSFFWICGHQGGSPDVIEWLDGDGQKFRYEQGTNGRPKNIMVGGYLVRVQLACDQPKCNYEIKGVKSSLR